MGATARAAVGFTVKSGWAAVVLLEGSAAAPRVAACRRVEISDPAIPDAKQPYHAGFGTARDAGDELKRLVASVKSYGRISIGRALKDFQDAHPLRGAGVVVGSLIDPKTIGNDHIRIHALEGQLFRSVVHDAATRSGLPCAIWRERDLYGAAATILEQPEHLLRQVVSGLGKGVDGPWRAEHKAAAVAAWLALARRRPSARRRNE